MKKIILLCLISTSSYVFSQDNVSVNFAQNFTTFKYADSYGNADPNMSSALRTSYGVNYSKVFHSGLFIRPELGYKNMGAQTVLNNQKLDWSLHYIDLSAGFGFQVRMRAVIPFVGVAPYYSYLYKGGQTYGNDYFDLIANKGIEKTDFGFSLFGGLKYQFSETNAVFLEVRNISGLKELEPNSEVGKSESLYNRAVSFHFGMSFNIPSKNRARRRSNF